MPKQVHELRVRLNDLRSRSRAGRLARRFQFRRRAASCCILSGALNATLLLHRFQFLPTSAHSLTLPAPQAASTVFQAKTSSSAGQVRQSARLQEAPPLSYSCTLSSKIVSTAALWPFHPILLALLLPPLQHNSHPLRQPALPANHAFVIRGYT